MIQIFGLLFFIILICLIYLYYQGKISRNIPIIFMFFLILIIPFTYLETNKTNVESYSDYNQIMNSSLDIFYTNQKSKRREMNELKKVKLIDNPIQTILVQKDIKPINLSIYVKYYTPYIGFWITAKSVCNFLPRRCACPHDWRGYHQETSNQSKNLTTAITAW